jgi:hypothetical protein
MTTRSSSRIAGLSPDFFGLPQDFGILNQNRKRTSVELLPQQPPSNQTFLSLKKQRMRTPASEPLPVFEKIGVQPPQAITEPEEVNPLTRDDILRILSKDMPMDKASIIEKFMAKSNIKNQQVESIYSSYFFRKDIVREFQNNLETKIPDEKKSNFPLSQYRLYNKDDILNNTFYRPDRLGTRYTEKTSGYTEESINNMQEFIQFLSKKICSDIGGDYAKKAVERALDLTKNEDKFDILVASTRVLENLTLPLTDRLQGIVAFIIVELGECQKYPSSYSINLICTDLKRAIPGTGSVLMGAYLYTVLSHPNNKNPSRQLQFPPGESFLNVTSKILSDGRIIENATFGTREPLIPVQQVAVLELASSYKNPGGLCMYEKFGFTYDQTMFSNDKVRPPINCFFDRNNLPMLINFETKPGYSELTQDKKKDKILNIIVGYDRGFPKSKICSLRDDNQRLLGYLKSIKLYLDNEPGATKNDFLSSGQEGVLLYQLSLIHSPPLTRTRRDVPTISRPGTPEEFIDYLENPPTTPHPDMEEKVKKLISFLPRQRKKGGMTRKKPKFIKINSRKRFSN